MGFAIFSLIFFGCANSLPRITVEPPRDEDVAIISATFDAWNNYGLPLVEPANVHELLVTDAEDAATFRALCRTSVTVGACATTRDRTSGPLGMFTPSNFWRLIVLSPGQRSRPQREGTIVHEVVHWLGVFAGIGLDHAHADSRRWCRGTCRDGNGVEGTARWALERSR